jgi:uncharacterized protein
MSYENKMMQMKKLLGKSKPVVEEKPSFQKPDAPPYIKNWQEAGLTLIENDFGVLFERTVSYPYTFVHGDYQLGELFDAISMWEASGIEHPFHTTSDETLVFFDTETTGLKGTGTHIFLIGLLTDTGKAFQLTQYVLADPSNETAFLFESKFWQKANTVITYNGKSFDWPQLEMRWTLNKPFLPPLKSPRQIDLLHSSKRIWRDDLHGMKLTKVETEKLGFYRHGDIPGHLAPIIYFDAVKSGNATSLMKVLTHNEWDLLSLITLYVHSTKLLMKELQETSISSTNIGKWYGDLKYRAISKATLTDVTESFNEREAAHAHYYLGYQHKKDGEVDEAIRAFTVASTYTDERMQEDAFLQLAILYEHKEKNMEKALHATEQGIHVAKRQLNQSTTAFQNRMNAWQKRLNRLHKKINNPRVMTKK